MDDSINVGLLVHEGSAHVGAYLSALRDTKLCRSVVLGDPDGAWTNQAREVLGDKLSGTYDSYSRLLSEKSPEMCLISMEAARAPSVISAALDAQCHVFAEKPACTRVADFRPLVRQADAAHRYLMLALANRLNPETTAARELIASGEIGEIYGLEMHLIADQTRLHSPSYHASWFADRDRAGGGHLIWLGIHWLDLAMYLTGHEITKVAGFIHNTGGQPIHIEDSAVASLTFGDRFLGTMTSGYYLDKGYHSHIKIWGSGGWLHLEHMLDEPLRWYTNAGPKAGETQVWRGSKQPRGYTPFVQAAVEACATMIDPPISSAHSLRALETVFAIYNAAESGETVTVPTASA